MSWQNGKVEFYYRVFRLSCPPVFQSCIAMVTLKMSIFLNVYHQAPLIYTKSIHGPKVSHEIFINEVDFIYMTGYFEHQLKNPKFCCYYTILCYAKILFIQNQYHHQMHQLPDYHHAKVDKIRSIHFRVWNYSVTPCKKITFSKFYYYKFWNSIIGHKITFVDIASIHRSPKGIFNENKTLAPRHQHPR